MQRFYLGNPRQGPCRPIYVMTGGNWMTDGERQFMMEVGIEPCTLYDPFPSPTFLLIAGSLSRKRAEARARCGFGGPSLTTTRPVA